MWVKFVEDTGDIKPVTRWVPVERTWWTHGLMVQRGTSYGEQTGGVGDVKEIMDLDTERKEEVLRCAEFEAALTNKNEIDLTPEGINRHQTTIDSVSKIYRMFVCAI